jgi:hypothetical protein
MLCREAPKSKESLIEFALVQARYIVIETHCFLNLAFMRFGQNADLGNAA